MALEPRADRGAPADTADEPGIALRGVFLVPESGEVVAKRIGYVASGRRRPAALCISYPCAVLTPFDVGAEHFNSQLFVV